MNRKRLALITGSILMILVGIIIGQALVNKSPERVVV